jgi:hypothetical protein
MPEILNSAVLSGLERLKLLEMESLKSNKRFAEYVYLAAAYDWFYVLKSGGKLELTCSVLAKHFDHKWSVSAHPLKLVLGITSGADCKVRSRWLRALQFADRKREDWFGKVSLAKFMHDNGGLAGCARKEAQPFDTFDVPDLRRDWK